MAGFMFLNLTFNNFKSGFTSKNTSVVNHIELMIYKSNKHAMLYTSTKDYSLNNTPTPKNTYIRKACANRQHVDTKYTSIL